MPTTLAFIEKAERIFRATQAAADAPSQLLSPETGALGPHLQPPRISPTNGQVILELDAAGRQDVPSEIIGQNGAAVPQFDPNLGPAAAPNLRFVHGSNSGGNNFGTGWGLAIRRVLNSSASRSTITTDYGDTFPYSV